MEKIYSEEIVKKYIDGEDIPYDIDELENNAQFMLKVFEMSKDTRMYNLCSDNLTVNYEFIISVIDIFKGDYEFIYKVATEYINYNVKNLINPHEQIQKIISLLLILDQYIPESNEFYKKNKEILNAAVYGIMRAIIEKNNINLQFLILARYNSYSEFALEQDKFYIEFFRLYNDSLACYLTNHIDTLDRLKKDLNLNEKNYEIQQKRRICKIIHDLNYEFFKYYDKHSTDFGPDIYGIKVYLYLAYKYNIAEYIIAYEQYDKKIVDTSKQANYIDENNTLGLDYIETLDMIMCEYANELHYGQKFVSPEDRIVIDINGRKGRN